MLQCLPHKLLFVQQLPLLFPGESGRGFAQESGQPQHDESGEEETETSVQLVVGRVAGPELLDGQSVPFQHLRHLLPHQVSHGALHHGHDEGHEDGEGEDHGQQVEAASLEPGSQVGGPGTVIRVDCLVHQGLYGVAVLLQAVESILYGLVDCLLNILAHFLYLVHTTNLQIKLGK